MSDIRQRLIDIRHSLQFASDSPGGGISDTLWMMHGGGTVFDALDSVIEATTALTGAQPAPAAPSPTVLRSDFDAKVDDLERAKRLLTSIYAMSPPAVRVVIERNTGAWFALGVNRDESAAPAAQPADSAMEVLRELVEAKQDDDRTWLALWANHHEAGVYASAAARLKSAWTSARALVAKETPHA